ncbi:hypothetical protein ACQUJS_19255 [Ralstonia pseudosolanacearum]
MKRNGNFVDLGCHVDFDAMLGKADLTVKATVRTCLASGKDRCALGCHDIRFSRALEKSWPSVSDSRNEAGDGIKLQYQTCQW